MKFKTRTNSILTLIEFLIHTFSEALVCLVEFLISKCGWSVLGGDGNDVLLVLVNFVHLDLNSKHVWFVFSLLLSLWSWLGIVSVLHRKLPPCSWNFDCILHLFGSGIENFHCINGLSLNSELLYIAHGCILVSWSECASHKVRIFERFITYRSSGFWLHLNRVINSKFFIYFNFFVHGCIHVLFALRLKLLASQNILSHPLMTKNVCHCRSGRGQARQQVLNEILELFCQIPVCKFFPVLARIDAVVSRELLILFILDQIRHCPWISNNSGHKQWNSESKAVCICSLVLDSLVMDFWSHVHWCAESGLHEAVLSLSAEWQAVT